MDEVERSVLEEELTRLCAARDFPGAATLALRGYGPEILGFLAAIHHCHEDATEVFAQFCEDLWCGLVDFEHRSSFRTWAYALARNASRRHRRGQSTHERRTLPLEEAQLVSQLRDWVRTRTPPYLRTDYKSQLQRLRATLPADEQALLILRVDRGLEWSELAQVMGEADALDEESLKRAAARLRKRYQQVKDKLRQLATDAGLLESE